MLKFVIVLCPMIAGAALAGTVRAATPLDIRADVGPSVASHGISRPTAFAAISDRRSTVASRLPEPASWSVMLLGFGLVGAVARHRRSKVSIAAA